MESTILSYNPTYHLTDIWYTYCDHHGYNIYIIVQKIIGAIIIAHIQFITSDTTSTLSPYFNLYVSFKKMQLNFDIKKVGFSLQQIVFLHQIL